MAGDGRAERLSAIGDRSANRSSLTPEVDGAGSGSFLKPEAHLQLEGSYVEASLYIKCISVYSHSPSCHCKALVGPILVDPSQLNSPSWLCKQPCI